MPSSPATPPRSNRSLLIGLTVLLVATFVAFGLWQRDSDDLSKPDESILNLTLSPQGNQGKWLKDSYRNGVDATFSTTDTVCAITEDVAVLSTQTPTGPRVSARNLRFGSVLWEHQDEWCNSDSGVDDLGVVVQSFSVTDRRYVLDPKSGVARRELPADVSSQPVAAYDELIIFKEANKLLAVDEQTVRWTWSRDCSEVVALPGAKLGVSSGLTDKAYALDAMTGKELWSRDTLPGGKWASDGYIEQVNESDPTYAFYDLTTGKEVDRTVGSSQYTFVPSPHEGVTFPIRDHVAAGKVVGVAADGRAALFEGRRGQDFTRSGPVDQLDSILDLEALTADGTALLVSKRSPEGIALLDQDGKTIWERPDDSWELAVEHGYLVTRNAQTTTVLLPNLR